MHNYILGAKRKKKNAARVAFVQPLKNDFPPSTSPSVSGGHRTSVIVSREVLAQSQRRAQVTRNARRCPLQTPSETIRGHSQLSPLGDHRRRGVTVDPSTALAGQQSQTLVALSRGTVCTVSERILRRTDLARKVAAAGRPQSLRVGSRRGGGGGSERLQDGRLRRRRSEGSA